MSTNGQGPKPHSAEHLGESRNHWWNADFVELIAKRLQLDQAKEILDVGCGIGHWGQVLSPKKGEMSGTELESVPDPRFDTINIGYDDHFFCQF